MYQADPFGSVGAFGERMEQGANDEITIYTRSVFELPDAPLCDLENIYYELLLLYHSCD